MTIKEQAAIDYIMNKFDFERVYNAMLATNWEWSRFGAPTIDEIENFAKSLLIESIENKQGVASGGFHVKYYNDYDPAISIEFIIEQSISRL